MKFEPMKDKKEEVPYFRAPGKVLYNAECIFVQYHDIIRCPWFTTMRILQYEDMLKGMVDFSEIDPFNIAAQLEWYINRPTRNFLDSLPINPKIPDPDKWKYDVIKSVTQTLYTNDVITNTFVLSPVQVFRVMLFEKTVKKMIVWDEMGLKGLDADIIRLFGEGSSESISVISTPDAKEALKHVPFDSTYFISDIRLVNDLVELDKLNLSSIILGDYGYNKDPKNNEFLIDLVELNKKHTFKFNLVSTFTIGNSPDGKNPIGIE